MKFFISLLRFGVFVSAPIWCYAGSLEMFAEQTDICEEIGLVMKLWNIQYVTLLVRSNGLLLK